MRLTLCVALTTLKVQKDELCKNSPAGSKQHNETTVNTRSTKCNHLHLFIVIIVVDDVVKSF